MPLETPDPPYYTVIFSTRMSDDTAGYLETAETMEALAAEQPGYLGIESVRGGREGITVSYWHDEDAIAAWKANVDHTLARDQGRDRWYKRYELRVARVERAYNWSRPSLG